MNPITPSFCQRWLFPCSVGSLALFLTASCVSDPTCADLANCEVDGADARAFDGGALGADTFRLKPVDASVGSTRATTSANATAQATETQATKAPSSAGTQLDTSTALASGISDAGTGSDMAVETTEDQDGQATFVEPSLLSDGQSCAEPTDCESNFCVDGVCCDTACDGLCAACDVAGSEGTCQSVETDQACGTLTCPPSTECLTYSGVGLGLNCAALDTCLTEAQCAETSVASGTPCQSGAGACDGQGECVVPDKKALGETCTGGGECGSNICSERTDGTKVCCDAACDGACQACSAAGRCSATPTDDAACGTIDCPSDTTCADYPSDLTSNRCSGFGQCVSASSYCAASFASSGTSCGSEQICNGAGSCDACPSNRGASRTCTAQCTCDAGAGICTSNAQCAVGLVCVSGGGTKYGFSGATCLPSHCDNDVQDSSEVSIDCGGDCGCTATLEVFDAYASVMGVSDDGNTVVGYSSNSTGSKAYVWDASGTRKELSSSHITTGISGDGTVIVGTGSGQAVRWVSGGAPDLLTPNYATSLPYSVSRNGSVVVGSGPEAAFVWTKGTVLAVDGFSRFIDTTSDGTVFLGVSTADVNGASEYSLWSSTNGTTPIVLPVGWAVIGAADMSGNGVHIVGSATGNPYGSAFLLSHDSHFVTLPSLVGGPTSAYSNSVSDDGFVVGEACRSCEGTYWAPANDYAVSRLDDFMSSRGLEVGALNIRAGRRITPNGKTIIGEGISGSTGVVWRLRLK